MTLTSVAPSNTMGRRRTLGFLREGRVACAYEGDSMALDRPIQDFFSSTGGLDDKARAKLKDFVHQHLDTMPLLPGGGEQEKLKNRTSEIVTVELYHFREGKDDAHKWKPGAGGIHVLDWLRRQVTIAAAWVALQEIERGEKGYQSFSMEAFKAFLLPYVRRPRVRLGRLKADDVVCDVYIAVLRDLEHRRDGGPLSCACSAEFADWAFTRAKESNGRTELAHLTRQVLEPHTIFLPLDDVKSRESYKDILEMLTEELHHFRERDDPPHKWKPGTGQISMLDWHRLQAVRVAAFAAFERIAAGKPEYGDFFIKCVRHFLTPYISAKVGPESAEVEDIVQEVCLKAWEDLKSLANGGPVKYACPAEFADWAFARVNESIRECKAKHKKGTHSIENLLRWLQHRSTTSAPRPWFFKALKQMNKPYSQVLWLRIEGYSDKQIGKKLGISDDNVKMRAYRGRNELRGFLGIEALRFLNDTAWEPVISDMVGGPQQPDSETDTCAHSNVATIMAALRDARLGLEDDTARAWLSKEAVKRLTGSIAAAIKNARGLDHLPERALDAVKQLCSPLAEAQVELLHVVFDHAYRALDYLHPTMKESEIPPEDLVPLGVAWWVLSTTLGTTDKAPLAPESEEHIAKLMHDNWDALAPGDLATDAGNAVRTLDQALGGPPEDAGECARRVLGQSLTGDDDAQESQAWMLLRAWITAESPVRDLVADLPAGIVADGLKALVARGNDPQAPEEPRRNGDNDNGL